MRPLAHYPTSRPRRGFTLIEMLVVISILGLLAVIMLPSFAHSRATSQYTACKGNLKNIALAFEMYAGENGGAYPNQASLVCPKFIAVFPTCPSAGRANYNVLTSQSPDIFTVICLGSHHQLAGIAAYYPQYQAGRGLVEP